MPRITYTCLVTVILFAVAALNFQSHADDNVPSFYSVKGSRDGASSFRKTNYAETRPVQDGVLDFRHYHLYDEVIFFLKKWGKEFPDLVEYRVTGQSFEGRDIPLVILTNKKTGGDRDKPAMLIDANVHGMELVTSESAFWMLDYLLENYGSDEDITELIDRSALYFRIIHNPDGREFTLQTPYSLYYSVQPLDDDGDGLVDEDPRDDLNGDGYVTMMRKHVGPNNGDFTLDPRDTTGRLMCRVRKGEGEWMVMSEGIDNDDDGKYNEDGVGGINLTANHYGIWKKNLRDGEYPLSEPESREFFLFLTTHPNLSIIQTMHAMAGYHVHSPALPEDRGYYDYFNREAKRITGYEYAVEYPDWGFYRRLTNPPLFDNHLRPPVYIPNHVLKKGSSPDRNRAYRPLLGYRLFGTVYYQDELYAKYGNTKDYDGNGLYDDYDGLMWNDEACGGRGFIDWTDFRHPEFGDIEIGGFKLKFFGQGPLPDFLEDWCRKEAMFNIFLAKQLPRIEIHSVEVKASGEKNTYDIIVRVTNTGCLPTALEQAKKISIVGEDRVALEFDNNTPGQVNIINNNVTIGWIKNGEIKTVHFKVRLSGVSSVVGTVHVSSVRGGHAERVISIN